MTIQPHYCIRLITTNPTYHDCIRSLTTAHDSPKSSTASWEKAPTKSCTRPSTARRVMKSLGTAFRPPRRSIMSLGRRLRFSSGRAVVVVIVLLMLLVELFVRYIDALWHIICAYARFHHYYSVRHPNIINFHDCWYNGGEFVFVTELMTSGTLREYFVGGCYSLLKCQRFFLC